MIFGTVCHHRIQEFAEILSQNDEPTEQSEDKEQSDAAPSEMNPSADSDAEEERKRLPGLVLLIPLVLGMSKVHRNRRSDIDIVGSCVDR